MRDVYERYGGAMFATAMSVLGNRDLAADAVQQAFVKAWRALAHLRSRARTATVARDDHAPGRHRRVPARTDCTPVGGGNRSRRDGHPRRVRTDMGGVRGPVGTRTAAARRTRSDAPLSLRRTRVSRDRREARRSGRHREVTVAPSPSPARELVVAPRGECIVNDEHLYASYLESGADGLDSTAIDGGAIDAATRGELDVLRRLLASDEIWSEPQPDLAEFRRGGDPHRTRTRVVRAGTGNASLPSARDRCCWVRPRPPCSQWSPSRECWRRAVATPARSSSWQQPSSFPRRARMQRSRQPDRGCPSRSRSRTCRRRLRAPSTKRG